MTTLGHLINGSRVAGEGRTQDIFNPSTGEVGGQVSLASKATVEDAIAAAQAARSVGAVALAMLGPAAEDAARAAAQQLMGG